MIAVIERKKTKIAGCFWKLSYATALVQNRKHEMIYGIKDGST
jgi:hypothetical protein